MWGVILTLLLFLSLLALVNSSVVGILIYLLVALVIGYIITKVVQHRRPIQ